MQEATSMPGDTETGMDRAKMKQLLTRSKQEPVNCAIGVGDDKSLALLMLASNHSARSLQADLQKQFPTAFNTRFGTAVVDTDDDPTLVKFLLNKPIGSMARRLVKTLKGTGFRKVQILLEDGSPVESATEEEASEQTSPGANGAAGEPLPPPASPQAAPKPDPAALARALTELVRRIAEVTDPARKDALARQAREANVNIKTGNLTYAAAGIESLRRALDAVAGSTGREQSAIPTPPSEPVSPASAPPSETAEPPAPPPPPPDAVAKPDPAALIAALTALARRIAEVADPARKEALAKLAREANVNIKTGNLTYAAAGIESLRRALDAVSGHTGEQSASPAPLSEPTASPIPSAAPDATPAQDASSGGDPRAIWREAKEAMDDKLNALASQLRAQHNQDMDRIAGLGLFSLGTNENVGMNRALLEFATASTEKRDAAQQQLRQAIVAYRAMLSQSGAIKLLASTPFGVAIPFQATLGGALDQIERTLRQRA
jgi:hypothetical protein